MSQDLLKFDLIFCPKNNDLIVTFITNTFSKLGILNKISFAGTPEEIKNTLTHCHRAILFFDIDTDCEFRFSCMDSRLLYKKEKSDEYYCKEKCNYDPYNGTFKEY